MPNEILLIGAGGHCKVVIDTIKSLKRIKIKGIIDKKEKIGEKVLDIPIIGEDSDLIRLYKSGYKDCFITVGSIGDPTLRNKLYKIARKIGYTFPTIIHPTAKISRFAKIGYGTFVASGAVISTDSVIGENCIINTGAIIDHDCVIDDNVHIATGAVLSGGVEIGACAHIGAGTVVVQYLNVGKKTLIGAGSTVTNDIESNVIAYGTPCKKIRKNNE